LYRTLGSTIGKIHALAAQFNQTQPTKIRPEWDGIPNNFNPESDQDPGLAILNAEREKVVNYLNSLPQELGSFGLIHGDLHLGNFFVDVTGNKITLFDFDDCVYGWFMMDNAILRETVRGN
jgi:Ser/Thr protein kinase RdoA (MazF antagonist)